LHQELQKIDQEINS